MSLHKFYFKEFSNCDHRLKKTRHPVRSAISKLQIARLVLWWVTTWESLVLQMIFFLLFVAY
ncbi:hypothetical protein L211DRAFT_895923 [Terfezia boudieri ATCC MYA-4762]|uniref:Uncharacterized protein n=1 Tax=Terfezia boudieri ATCC MYA-4762 TaxID=1051890 RepID=A0A3N4LA51_9PEZI|nr:hypothetical protein L211DRAFT_895923 [Terfezia boudieri ATCC MYA-4762]